jgi:septum site-determining protein MinD
MGKTTTTRSLAISLARLGLPAVDADDGLHNLDLLLGFKNRVHFAAANVLMGDYPLNQPFVRHRVLHP